MLLAAALALPGAAPVDPLAATEAAVRMLLAASSLPVPKSASCQGVLPFWRNPTIGDLVATPLANLDGGKNQISGGCEYGQCHVDITHEGEEEDVFSYQYRFTAARGRLVPASLECFNTP